MNRTARSVEELFPIIGYARAGDLKAVKEWIAAGSPLNLPPGKKTRRQSPLQIAIGQGFLTLVEMLLEGGADPEVDGALWHAVNHGRTDIARLLLARGAPVKSVSFQFVCACCETDMIELFLECGADQFESDPFYDGLTAHVDRVARIFKPLLEREPRLQPQADHALNHFIEERKARGVALMVWAGARPDNPLGDTSDAQTALESAASSGDFAIFKSLHPEKYPALLPKLVESARFATDGRILELLWSMGAPVNDTENGTCSALSNAIWQLGSDAQFYSGDSGEKAKATLARIESLLGKGAKLEPMDASALRRHLKHVPADGMSQLFDVFRKHGLVSRDVMLAAVSTPAMKGRLGLHWSRIQAAIEGPKAPPPTPGGRRTTLVPEEPKIPMAELRERVEAAVIGIITESPYRHFSTSSASAWWSPSDLRRRIKVASVDRHELAEVLRAVQERLARRFKSADLQLKSQSANSLPSVSWTLRADFTWETAYREALGLRSNESLPLSPAAEALWTLVDSGQLGHEWHRISTIARQIDSDRSLATLCGELAQRAHRFVTMESRRPDSDCHDPEVRLQKVDAAWHHAILAAQLPDFPWTGSLYEPAKAELDRYRELLVDWALQQRPQGTQPVCLFRFASCRDVYRSFRQIDPQSRSLAGSVVRLLKTIRFPASLRLCYDLQDHVEPWWIAFAPVESWEKSLAAIHAERAEPKTEDRLGLSYDAARLLEWIERTDRNQFFHEWTPIVENALKSEIGFRAQWPEDNLPALFQVLIAELNAKTAYDLSLQPWNDLGKVKTRIRVAKKPSHEAALVSALEAWAHAQGVSLSAAQRAAALTAVHSVVRTPPATYQ